MPTSLRSPEDEGPSSSSQQSTRVPSPTPELNHHTYHIPNHYSRRALSGGGSGRSGLYQPLKQHDQDDEEAVVSDEEPPQRDDTPNWALLTVFALLGAAILLPFNTLVTPTEYYRTLFAADHSRSEGFLSWVLLVYNVSSISLGAHATVSLTKTTPPRRIFISASTVLAGLLLFSITTRVATSAAYYALLAGVAFIAGSAAYLQNAVVALCSIFGGQAMGLMLSGQGVVGAIIAAVQLAAAYRVQRADPSGAATALFAFATAFMALVLAAFAWLVRTQRFRRTYGGYEAATVAHAVHAQGSSRRDLLDVQRKVALLSLSVFYIYVVTLSVYPALTARVISHGDTPPLVFIAWHLLAFNLSDVAGRTLPSITGPLLSNPKIIAVAVLARTAFVPAFLACNFGKGGGGLPDWFFFACVVAFGLSNGLLSTSIFVCAAEDGEMEDTQRASAGAILSFWLTIGLAAGSALSFAVVAMAA
ncbi:hypothetical protein BDZ90DRAFT_32754 [Jaminaea rosea]|uniref:Nucleoside transporter n=1 Tax=Jaminaea rosea TaxID=1569628 RepID=A0A316V0J2_9BASI|nr:hypothetical protein BDZ90DRAFT_32754 [Jaminaea rosea]PWN31066.1 hypothetical protein BDZ90DRAFT_32754 [Jaminaea rosea]